MIKTRYWILLIILITAVCLFLFFFLYNKKPDTVEIVRDGTVLYTINLDNIKDEYDIKIEYNDHDFNTVCVCKGDIYIKESSCDGKDCIKRGRISAGGFPIICAPNKLIIRYTNNQYDGIAG